MLLYVEAFNRNITPCFFICYICAGFLVFWGHCTERIIYRGIQEQRLWVGHAITIRKIIQVFSVLLNVLFVLCLEGFYWIFIYKNTNMFILFLYINRTLKIIACRCHGDGIYWSICRNDDEFSLKLIGKKFIQIYSKK